VTITKYSRLTKQQLYYKRKRYFMKTILPMILLLIIFASCTKREESKVNRYKEDSISQLVHNLYDDYKYFPDEYLQQLKIFSKTDVIKEFEKDIIIKLNREANYERINQEIYFVRKYFGSSNDTLFRRLGSICFYVDSLDRCLFKYTTSEPTSPYYEKPKYNGALYMYAEYVGPFDEGGIILKANGEYYLARNAHESRNPFARYYHGYIEKTGETINLNRGRHGTECEIINIKDEETYRDDQKSYRDRLKEAQEDYRRELVTYKEDLQAYKKDAAIVGKINQQKNNQILIIKDLIKQFTL
jgi:hypothetical protein